MPFVIQLQFKYEKPGYISRSGSGITPDLSKARLFTSKGHATNSLRYGNAKYSATYALSAEVIEVKLSIKKPRAPKKAKKDIGDQVDEWVAAYMNDSDLKRPIPHEKY